MRECGHGALSGATACAGYDIVRVAGGCVGQGPVQSWVVGSGVPAEGDVASGDDMQRATIAALLDHYALEDGDGSRNERAEGMPPIVVDAGALDLLPCMLCRRSLSLRMPANWPHC